MTFDKKNIATIILKEQYDACTPEELLVLEQWYKTLDDKSELERLNSDSKDLKKKTSWEVISRKIDELEQEQTNVVEARPGKPIIYYITRIAAIFILVACSYAVFNWFDNKPLNSTVVPIKYFTESNSSEKPKKIILPDNSLLWLAAKSSIKYPERFTQSRSISLVAGKVFFNVAHDPSKPFTVETVGGLKTTVLGTAFVIEEGSTNSSVKVSVLRGKVQVADNVTEYATLARNQSVEVNSKTKEAHQIGVDSLEMTGWFASKVVLDNVTLKEVAASIKENFGYQVEFSSTKLSKKRCSITFNATDDVEDILILLDKVYYTKHTFSNKIINIKPAR